MKKQKFFVRFVAILLALAMIAGSGVYLVYMISPASLNVYAADASADTKAYKQLDDLKDVIEAIQENYRDKLTVQQLVNAAYEGVFDSLDEWSIYYPTEEEKSEFTTQVEERHYSGVGLTISLNKEDQCVVTMVNPKGAGYEQGVKVNDIITRIDGKSIAGWSTSEISKALRGEAGTTVAVEFARGSQTFTVTLERRDLVIESATYKMLDNNVGYINLSDFNEGAADSLYDSCIDLLSDGAESFIIDLRDNTGGLMNEALDAAALFLHAGDPMISYVQQGQELESYTLVVEEPLIMNHKVVLLVNEGTASAAEAFALMLHDNKAATLVGTKTYGKGVYQRIYNAENGDSFKLTSGYFYGPNKVDFNGVGITPDYLVYNGSGMTQSDAFLIECGCVPMTEQKKYVSLYSYGLNVLAAQQRLQVLGYDVPTNGILTGETMKALSQVQKNAGVGVYGGLDFTTMNILEQQFQAYLYGSADAQLAKAQEVILKK